MGRRKKGWTARVAAASLAILAAASLAGSRTSADVTEAQILDSIARFSAFVTDEIPEAQTVGGDYTYVFVGGVLYVNVGYSGWEPHLVANSLALESLSFLLKNADLLGMGGDSERLGKARRIAESICEFLLRQSSDRLSGSLWAGLSGRFVDMTASYYALRGLMEAAEAGVISTSDQDLRAVVASLVALQNTDGGYGISPGHSQRDLSESNLLTTSMALDVLVRAKRLGFGSTVGGLDGAIERAVAYLQGSSVRQGDQVKWEGFKFQGYPLSDEEVTVRVAGTLARADLDGVPVDEDVLAGAAGYITNYASLNPRWDEAPDVLHSLLLMSSLGLVETRVVKGLALQGANIETLLNNQYEDGLWYPPGGPGDPISGLDFSTKVASFLLDWAKIVSLDVTLSASGRGYFGDSDPPRLVESGVVGITISVANSGTSNRLISVSHDSPPGLDVVNETQGPISVPPGGEGRYTLTFRAPEVVSEPTTLVMTFSLRDASSGDPLYTRRVTLEIVRDARLKIISKTASPQRVRLGGTVTVSVTVKNVGDVPAQGCTIWEDLADGFVLTQAGNYSEVAAASTTGYPYLSFIPAGRQIEYTYTLRAERAGPGEVSLSTTKISYSNSLGDILNATKEVFVTVERPLVETTLNASEVELEWGQGAAVRVDVTNEGNAASGGVSLRVKFGGDLDLEVAGENVSISRPSENEYYLDLGGLDPNETRSVVLKISTSAIYLNLGSETRIDVITTYLDPDGRVFQGFEDSDSADVILLMSTSVKVAAGIVSGLIALLAAVRLSAYRRRKKREARYRYRAYRPSSRARRTGRSARGIRSRRGEK